MKQFSFSMPNLISKIKQQAGFTMIELLIVISILGILAVAVLSAINPIEQINRGRDTGSQSDAEQLIGAVERYYAYNGTYPWQGTASGAALTEDALNWGVFNDDTANVNAIPIVTELLAKQEVKDTFTNRLNDAQNPIYIYNEGDDGTATYVCFDPASQAFQEQATTRCAGTPPDDYPAAACPGGGADAFFCLP